MTKNKEKKGKESTIGKIIYGFLLFMPLIAIGVTSITCFWNKEITADTQTAEIEYKYQTNEVNSISDLIVGNTYQITVDNTNDSTNRIYCSGIITTSKDNEILIFDDVYYVRIDTAYLYVYSISTGTLMSLITYDNNELTIGCTFSRYSLAETTIDLDRFSEYTGTNIIENVNITSTPQDADIKNIFYYSVDKVEQSNLFNWAKNSIVYTTLVATCNALSITNTFIPMLLAYWLIISVIYILYDIALMMLIIFHHKVHCLQDSI